MAFREVRVFEVREVLRLWLRGEGIRSMERLAGVDRKTVRRYVAAAVEFGLVRGGEEQLSDEFIGSVVEAVRPHRSDGRGEAWRLLMANHQLIEEWLKKDMLTVRKTHELLGRRGLVVPERTLHRYALEVCDAGGASRCAWMTASRATSARSTSASSASSWTATPAGVACVRR